MADEEKGGVQKSSNLTNGGLSNYNKLTIRHLINTREC